jgi:hypothetical protein
MLNEVDLLEVFKSKSETEKRRMDVIFKKIYGIDMITNIYATTSGEFKFMLIAIASRQCEFEADCLEEAMVSYYLRIYTILISLIESNRL